MSYDDGCDGDVRMGNGDPHCLEALYRHSYQLMLFEAHSHPKQMLPQGAIQYALMPLELPHLAHIPEGASNSKTG